MWNRTFAIILLGLAAAAFGGVVAFGTLRERPIRFENLFRQALADGSHDDEMLVDHLASRFDVCVYGGRNENTKAQIELFFAMVRETTWLQPTLYFEHEIVDCDVQTFMYVNRHNGGVKLKSTIVGDMSFIISRAGMTEFNFQFSEYGLGTVLIEDGKEPRAYAALNELVDATTEVDIALARNIVQQELLQLLLVAVDIEVDRQPVSIVEEQRIPNLPEGEDEPDPRNRALRASLNVPNMCLYDVMLLMTLYAHDESILDAKLGSYIRYIRSNYPALERAARQIQNNPRYRDIFASKC